MIPEIRKYLWDARTAGRLILDIARGSTFDNYQADVILRSAVERQFEVLGAI